LRENFRNFQLNFITLERSYSRSQELEVRVNLKGRTEEYRNNIDLLPKKRRK
jgi:hypothetical protein